jgi:uncharacterized membrane protein YkvA (DUF1232 family)
MTASLESLKQWARRLKLELVALYLCYRDPRVPWYARLFAGAVVAYAFSPIDLIPDFIPVLGLLDDLLLVPLGIWLALKMIPAEVIADSRARAAEALRDGKPVNRAAAVVIVAIWLLMAAFSVALLLKVLRR